MTGTKNIYKTITYKGLISDELLLLRIENPQVGDLYAIDKNCNDSNSLFDSQELYIYSGKKWISFTRTYASLGTTSK